MDTNILDHNLSIFTHFKKTHIPFGIAILLAKIYPRVTVDSQTGPHTGWAQRDQRKKAEHSRL